ncbi:nucleotidyltransferase family protein [Phytohabitans rumicis]|uniref:4-diphosphocytidyl-2C-methyl-D-erythritol synthase n=1 Tax=Phytohabitans rumicis TaxID=1076125 RepID=A0A6V8LDY7_9ACTN|nr:nucleotidyltransferase family protein [Phytohabitans rumicis]GFJ92789.1 4-diphosphocytidyl-2C-methyl-D-erythritol synthase [Phytohabitans rumicis]
MLLAAGAGRRYGMPKALARRDGRLMVEWAADTLREGGCAPVVVVLGAAAEQVRAEARLDATTVDNVDWATGMGSSLRTGLASLDGTRVSAAVVLLVDLPGVTATAVRRLAALAAPDALVMAGYGDRRGHPVLLGRDHWAGVAALAVGDVGAKPYLSAHAAAVRVVPCDDVADDRDVDVPEEHTGSHA